MDKEQGAIMEETVPQVKPKFQISTYYPLACSKRYFNTMDEVKEHIKKCVKMTNDYRKKNEMHPISSSEAEQGIRVLKLNHEVNENVMNLVGSEIEMRNTNLREVPVRDRD